MYLVLNTFLICILFTSKKKELKRENSYSTFSLLLRSRLPPGSFLSSFLYILDQVSGKRKHGVACKYPGESATPP